MARSRIGVFGGSFDPIHIGHLAAAAAVKQELGLDRVLMMVANEPWQKVGTRDIADADLRCRMVEAAVAGYRGLEVSRLEVDRGGPSYMADTLAELTDQIDDGELVLIVGADTARNITTWARWHEVAELASLAVVNRPGETIAQLGEPWRATSVEIPALEVSSTELRARLAAGKSVNFLIPTPALVLLARCGIYPGLQENLLFSE